MQDATSKAKLLTLLKVSKEVDALRVQVKKYVQVLAYRGGSRS
jgi:hypothetical protein